MSQGKTSKTEFGNYLAKAIKEAGLSQAEFIAEVGMARPYFYDILKGSPPPHETLDKMMQVLDRHLAVPEERRNTFVNLAAKCRGEIPADIEELIKSHPDQWDLIRKTLKKCLSQRLEIKNERK